MENSIDNIRAISLYLLMEGDYGQVENINQSGKDKFDAWEMEAYLAYAVFKTGEVEQALNILARSSYSKGQGIALLFAELQSLIQGRKSHLESLGNDDEDLMIVLAEILCLEGRMKEANVLIAKLSPGFKKWNIEGFCNLLMFRFSFDKSRDFQNYFDLQGSEFFLLNCKKSFLQSTKDFENNIQAVMGLALVAFFQKDWKSYSLKLSLLKSRLNNKSVIAYEKLKFSLSQGQTHFEQLNLPTCTGLKISLIESLQQEAKASSLNCFSTAERQNRFSALLSTMTAYQHKNFKFLIEVVSVITGYFELLANWQREVVARKFTGLVNELVLNFDFLDSAESSSLLKLFENLLILFIQLGDLESAKFICHEVKKLQHSTEVLTLLSIMTKILLGNVNDADSALSLFEDINRNNSFLFEIFVLTKLLLKCQSPGGQDLASTHVLVKQYASILKSKRLLSQKYPRCLETLSASHLGLSTVVFDRFLRCFSFCFQQSVLGLALQGLSLRNFFPRSTFLKILSPLAAKSAELSEHFFIRTEQSVSFRIMIQLIKGKLGVFSQEQNSLVPGASYKFNYVINCRQLTRALHQGECKGFLEFILHKKSFDLTLNNNFSFMFFEILGLFLNQGYEKCTFLISKAMASLQKKEFVKNELINGGMVQVLAVLHRLLGKEGLPLEKFRLLDKYSHSLLPWEQVQTMLESHSNFLKNKVDVSVSLLLKPTSAVPGGLFENFALERLAMLESKYEQDCLLLLLQSSLDFSHIFRLLSCLNRSGQLESSLEVLDYILGNWKTVVWKDLFQFLDARVKDQRSSGQLSSFSGGHSRHQQLKLSVFVSSDDICVLQLLKGRVLNKLSLFLQANDFYTKMISSPNSSFFVLDFAVFLIEQARYLEALNLLDLESYFQQDKRTLNYKAFREVFTDQSLAKLEYHITELQLVSHCLVNLTGNLPKGQNSEAIVDKLDSLTRDSSTSASEHFTAEINMANAFIVELSEVKATQTPSTNAFKAFIDSQSHLMIGLKHCPRDNSSRYLKLEKMAIKKQNSFSLEDFVACPDVSDYPPQKGLCSQIQQSIQAQARLFIVSDQFMSPESTTDLFTFLKNFNAQKISKHNRKNTLPSPSRPDSPPCFPSNLMGKLVLFLSQQSSASACNMGLVSNLKQNTFRSKSLQVSYYSTENLFRLRNIEQASQVLDFDRLKEESKGVLRTEYKPEAIWGLVDSLLLKKKFASNAEGFFKMLKKEQLTTKNLNLVFAVGLFLLHGGLLQQCRNYLNLLLEPERLQMVKKIASSPSQANPDDLENRSPSLKTEYVYSKADGVLSRQQITFFSHKSYYALFDQVILRSRQAKPQIGFILGLYFYKIKRLDSASQCFVHSLANAHLQVPALMHLLDISLHEAGYNLYSNHFYKEKYSKVSAASVKNLNFIVRRLCAQQIPACLRKSLLTLAKFTSILNSGEEDKQLILETHEELKSILAESPGGSSAHCLALYLQTIILLKTKQISGSKNLIKANLVQSRNLRFLPYFGQNIFFFRCTMLCADILLSKDKTSAALQLINKAIEFDKSSILLTEHLILLQKKGLKDKAKALKSLERAVEITRFSEPNLGYRLAQDYLAQGNFAKAYHVSTSILKSYPNFNELKANVLGPAQKKLYVLI